MDDDGPTTSDPMRMTPAEMAAFEYHEGIAEGHADGLELLRLALAKQEAAIDVLLIQEGHPHSLTLAEAEARVTAARASFKAKIDEIIAKLEGASNELSALERKVLDDGQ